MGWKGLMSGGRGGVSGAGTRWMCERGVLL